MKKRTLVGLSAAVFLAACTTAVTPQAETQPVMESAAEGVSASSVSSSLGTLSFNYAFGVPSAKIIVGPATGRVEVSGLPDVADGTVFNGIRRITWNSGAGDDGIDLEINQARDFDVVLNPGTSNANIMAKWVIPAGAVANMTPSLRITTGPGQKKVQVDLESFNRDVQFDLIGRMGAGDTEFIGNLQFKQGTLNAAANVDFRFSGANGDKAELIVDNEARNLNLSLNPSLMKELVTKVISDDPSDSASVNFNTITPAGGGKVDFEMISAAPVVTLNPTVRGGAGVDEAKLSLTTINTARVTSNLNIDLALSNDKLEIKYDGLPSNQNVLRGPINLGGGNDETVLVRQGLTNWGIALDCGEGLDKATGYLGAVNCELN